MKRGKIIVAVTNDLVTDNRVDKVCRFLNNSGFEVFLVGRRLKSSLPIADRPYKTKRMFLLSKKGPIFYAEYNVRLFLLILFRRSQHILANDLDTLLASFLAARMKRNKLYYDTHELFTEVPELMNRPRVKRIWELIERWIFPKLNQVYTVNDSIAAYYSKKYNKHVNVVRNVAPRWHAESVPSRVSLGLPENKELLIVQGAGINIDRGIEELVEAMPLVSDSCCLIIVGSGDVIDSLKSMVVRLELSERVLFFGKRPYNEMMAFTHHASWGLSLDKDSNMNYQFSLPNKIFDYIHALTPIICTDLVEIRNIVAKHEVGAFIANHIPVELAYRINELVNNKQQHATFVANCKKASKVLCWENEILILNQIYTFHD